MLLGITPGTVYMLEKLNTSCTVHTKEEFSVSVMFCVYNTNLRPPSHI